METVKPSDETVKVSVSYHSVIVEIRCFGFQNKLIDWSKLCPDGKEWRKYKRRRGFNIRSWWRVVRYNGRRRSCFVMEISSRGFADQTPTKAYGMNRREAIKHNIEAANKASIWCWVKRSNGWKSARGTWTMIKAWLIYIWSTGWELICCKTSNTQIPQDTTLNAVSKYYTCRRI